MKISGRKSRGCLYALIFLISIFQLPAVYAQNESGSTVKGAVHNINNEPMSGVTVVIRNTRTNFTTGTSTDNDGNFSFSGLTSGGPYSLTFSMVGFEKQILGGYNIKSDATLSLVVKMVQTASSLDQVVVVGYGTQKRKDLTGSVVAVSGKEVKDLGLSRIDQGLAGRAPGVQVKQATGQPGSPPQIRVRGIGSISAGVNPLYVVDGFPIDNIQTLNPNDIESLDILKDASATAIYGSRGANGVIIINTKRGKAGKPVVSLDAYYGQQKVSRIPKMKNSKEHAQWFLDGMKNKNIDLGNDVSGDPTKWAQPVPQAIVDVLSGKNTVDHEPLDEILVNAPQQMISLSAYGGSDQVKYGLSGEYMNQDGIVINSKFQRYSLRANIDAKLSDRLTIRVNVNPSFTNQASLPSTGVCCLGSGVVAAALNIVNYRPMTDGKGNYTNYDGLADLAAVYNPLAVAQMTKVSNKLNRILGNVSADYRITNDLHFNVLVGGSMLQTKSRLFKPQEPYFFNELPFGSDSTSQITNWLTEYTLNYNKSFGKHNIQALGGYTVQKEMGEWNALSSNKFPNNLVSNLSAVGGLITYGTSSTYQWSLLSYLARINYNYDSKYYLTASFRTDGSSRFGIQNKWGSFPSLAAAWRLSQEHFLSDVSYLSELKLRVSYGQTGNNNIGNYDQYATISYENYPFGNVPVSGIAPARIANPNLTWEKQASFNVGVDASFFQRRLNLSVDHFESKNTDLLLNVNVPNNTGYSTALQNIGEVHNKGWEFVLSTVNITGAFEWTTDFNLSTYRNKVIRLGPQGDPIYSGNNVTMIGKPIGMFYGLITDGVFKNAAELAKGPIFNPGGADRSRVGDVRFKDISGPNGKPDGVINNFDRTIMGSPYPDFYYGMTNRFSYKNITLSVTIQGSKGSQVYDMARDGGYSGRARVRGYAFSNNYWKSEQQPGDGKTPRPNDNPTGGFRLPSTKYLDNGTYLRFNNITLAYSLPQSIVKKWKLNGLRVYINATNQITITKNTNFNPDVSMNENPLQPGIESSNYPLPKGFIGGINVTF